MRRMMMMLLLLVCVWSMELPVCAQENVQTNSSAGYQVIVDDEADLLSDEEEQLLRQRMEDIAVYGGVAFKSIDRNDSSTDRYIRSYYETTFGTSSGTVFLIDMDNRNIWIHSNGAIYKVITKNYADTITDNVYKFATAGDYFACAYEAFSQIHTLLEGNRVAQPMKYACNAILAIVLALMINYYVARIMSRASAPGEKEILDAAKNSYQLINTDVEYLHTTKIYSPQSDGGGGGSSSGGGSSGGGGGGGGGGGHSF